MTTPSVAFTKRVIYFSFFALLASFVWFLVGLPAWQTFHTDIAFQSFIAFSAIACIAVSLLANKERKNPFLVIFQAAMFYAAALHLGIAVDMLFTLDDPLLTRSTSNLFSDLIELVLFSILLFISIYSTERYGSISEKRLYILSFTTAAAMLIIYGATSGRFVPIVPESVMPVLSFFLFAVIIILLVVTINLVYKSAHRNTPYHSSSFIVCCILLIIAAAALLIPIYQPSLVWTFSVTLHSIAFFVLYLSVTVPYLHDVGMKPRDATIFASGFSALFLTPFFVTMIVEGVIPGFYNPDMSAYTIVHLGAASLSAVMALLTYGHAKTKNQPNLYPLILLFASWTAVDIAQVALSRFPAPYIGESLVPYITGSIVSLFSLYLAIRWTMNKPPTNLPRAEIWPVFGFVFQTSLLTLAEFIQVGLSGAVPILLNSPLGRSTLLIITFAAMFEFTYFIVYLSRRAGGGLAIEVLLSGFLALWMVPNILKANFLDWTAGWYSAELLLLIGLLFGPGLLGLLYIREMRRSEDAHQRARVYSDLLVHDISNYHQAILISLGLLEVDSIHPGVREQIVKDAQTELHRADELIRNVRQIGMSEEIALENRAPLDLVQSIRNSFENAFLPLHRQSIEFSINRDLGECYVYAHQLIEGIFTNLFRNAIQYSSNKKRIEVEIEKKRNQEKEFWLTRVIDFGCGIEPKKKANLFNRFMSGAEGTGLGLSVVKTLTEVFGGKITVEDRVQGDYSQGSVFIVTLPAAP
ncbi:MAG: sensor histidine kinase [Candidatus Sifarchaeia archaeon]